MMPKLWLGIVLGVILGVAVSSFPSQTVLQQQQRLNMPLVPITATGPTLQQPRFETVQPPSSQLRTLLVGLVAGLVVALPAFLIAKRRS